MFGVEDNRHKSSPPEELVSRIDDDREEIEQTENMDTLVNFLFPESSKMTLGNL